MPLKQGKTSQHHNWPRCMDCPQNSAKKCYKTGEQKARRTNGTYFARSQEVGGEGWLGHAPGRLGLSRRNFGTFPERPQKRSQSFSWSGGESWNIPSRVRPGTPKPYNSRNVKPPEQFQYSLPLSTAGRASFSRSGSGGGLSELVMEFQAVLRVVLSGGAEG